MRKQSQMGASKYEFAPQQLEIDIQKNKQRYDNKYQYVENQLLALLKHDSIRQEETWNMIIEILRDIKLKEGI